MRKQCQFYLNGYGHLRSMDLTGHQATTCIEVNQVIVGCPDNSDKPDHIFLECQVPARLNRQLQRITQRCPSWKGMLVRFGALYDRFGFCHAGQQCDDPSNMLSVKCQLLNLKIL